MQTNPQLKSAIFRAAREGAQRNFIDLAEADAIIAAARADDGRISRDERQVLKNLMVERYGDKYVNVGPAAKARFAAAVSASATAGAADRVGDGVVDIGTGVVNGAGSVVDGVVSGADKIVHGRPVAGAGDVVGGVVRGAGDVVSGIGDALKDIFGRR